MKILVTGANGQLGTDLVRTLHDSCQVFGLGRKELDITKSSEVKEAVSQIRPDVILHCAAYTKVDQAEAERETAFLVNAYGARNVAVAAQQVGAKMTYISTDYVFDGTGCRPYHEFDSPNPISIYGKSKLAGEEMVKMFSTKYFIVRTSWIYGKHGHNFIKTILKLAKEGRSLSIVDDQIGSPTYTVDLSSFLKELIATDQYGTYHATNSGHCSWYDFAKAILEESKLSAELLPINSDQLNRPAPRPSFSVLDDMSIRLNGFPRFRYWRDALKEFVKDGGHS